MASAPWQLERPGAFWVGVVLSSLLLLLFAAFHPGYLSDLQILGALIFVEILFVAIANFRKTFLLFLVLCFFWAATDLPLASAWTSGRWLVLAVGAGAGIFLQLRHRSCRASLFHFISALCLLAALISAFVSLYPTIAFLKAFSLLLLFVYGWFGARIAVESRETQFASGLLIACEVLVYGATFAYFGLHREIFGNPNSLGAVQGVFAVPTLLWGLLTCATSGHRIRYSTALGLSLLLLFSSYSRAGIVAAAGSCIFLCVGLRQYRLLVRVVISSVLLAAIAAVLVPLPAAPSESFSVRYLYKGHREDGFFGSRRSVWEQTFAAIQEHPWFGSGFGTSLTGEDDSQQPDDLFDSAPQATREHGNSYLAIVEWNGLLGSLPFFAVVIMLIWKIASTATWMRRSGNAFPAAVLLAAIVTAGLLDTGFEDWLFAPGYYLCLFFWTCAFSMMDFLPGNRSAPGVRQSTDPCATYTPILSVPPR